MRLAHRAARRTVRFAGLLVPRTLRARWIEEWEAELWHAAFGDARSRSPEALLAHAIGACRDAWKSRELPALMRTAVRNSESRRAGVALADIGHDVRYAVRTLTNNPGFTLFAGGALALGIGANTAIFSVVNGVLLRPLPFGEPHRIVAVWETAASFDRGVVAPANFLDWEQHGSSFQSMAAIRYARFNLTGTGEPERISARSVSTSFFDVMGVPPMLGRGFSAGDDTPGNRIVVLGHGLWQRRFGGDSTIVGRDILLNAAPHTVVGVMPPGFEHPVGHELWTPLVFTPEERGWRRSYFLAVVARLAEGITVDDAQATMSALAARLAREYPESNDERGVNVVPLRRDQVDDVRANLWMLLGAVGFVLLIACANVANLLLARGAHRGKEVAIRAALGAGKRRLLQQFLTDSIILGLLGGTLGLLLAWGGIQLLIALSPANFPRLDAVYLDLRVLAYTVGVSILTGVVFGLIPAFRSSRADLTLQLRESVRMGTRSVRRPGARQVGGALVIAEIAFALILFVGSGLLIRSFVLLTTEEPGFEPEGLLAVDITLPSYKYPEPSQQLVFFEQLMSQVELLPNVTAVATVNALPFSQKWYGASLSLEQLDDAGTPRTGRASVLVASAEYFRTLGIPVRRGRVFDGSDHEGSSGVVVVNEEFVRRYLSDEDPIGQRVAAHLRPRAWRTIIGVVSDVKQLGLDDTPEPQVYRLMSQVPRADMLLVARTEGDPSALIATVRAQVRSLDPTQPITRISTMDGLIAESVAQPRFYTTLLAVFAAVAVLLAAVGVYGLLAYSVSQRTHEMGIRMALGARRAELRGLVVRQGMVLVLSGIVVGVAGAYSLTRYLSSLLYEIDPTDTTTFVGIAMLLLVVGLVATYVPARGATRVDPVEALRWE